MLAGLLLLLAAAAALAVSALREAPLCVWNMSTLAGSGSAAPFANGVGTLATFNSPAGVSVDQLSNALYVADSGNNRIRRVSQGGVVGSLAGSG